MRRTSQGKLQFDSYDFRYTSTNDSELMVHFRRPTSRCSTFRLRLLDSDAVDLLARGGLWISDGQNAVLQRRVDILGL